LIAFLAADVTLGVRRLAESVLEYIRRQGLLKAGDRAGVAVSGGADSVALLRLLLELRQEIGLVLSVVHFNHNLRGAESGADAVFVARLAESHELELHSSAGDVPKHAKGRHLSVEAAARQLRYQYFLQLMGDDRLNCIATGHTLDDQAETVLLRMVRGAGTRGLAGIYPKLIYPPVRSRSSTLQENSFQSASGLFSSSQFSVDGSRFSVVRPLLGTSRADVEAYLREVGQDWCEDSSNRDLRYARNRLRHGILPRLARALNPKVKETLAETAEIARSEEDYWQKEVERVLPEVWEPRQKSLAELGGLPLALRRRVVRAAAESVGLRLEFRHVEEVLGLGSATAKSAMLPDGWVVTKTRDGLQFGLATGPAKFDYEYFLAVPGMVHVPEAGSRFEATIVPGGVAPGYNPDHVLNPALLQKVLTVRNWRPGDRFWPAHSKSPKKIKELLQERKLGTPERKVWPVVVSGEEIVWVRGFPSPARLRPPEAAKQALVIQEYSKA
jgi:tRNA(Ile)-lysidine synthase